MPLLHQWNLTPTEAVELQQTLREAVVLAPLEKTPRTIAGADVSLEHFGTELFCGIIVFSYPDLTIIDQATAKVDVSFPYIPGLLSFREVPGLLECHKKLTVKPDILIVDGQGIAHPRRLGIASHIGLLLDIPTIGCAKSRLYGENTVPQAVGEMQTIKDPKTGEAIGAAYKSKVGSGPLVISPGHKITIDESVAIIKTCLRKYRLPEPTRLAHRLVNEFRKEGS